MNYSYLITIGIIFVSCMILDINVSKIIFRHAYKLLILETFMFGILFLHVYVGVIMKLWDYSGVGIIGLYFLDIPVEEYIFMLVAPYAAVVVWESLHKIVKKHLK